MKRNLIALLAVPIFLLSSCNSGVLSPEEYKSLAIDAASKLQSIDNLYTKFDCNYEGHVTDIDVIQYYGDTTGAVPGKAKMVDEPIITDRGVSNLSVFYNVPVYLDPDNFYKVSEGLVLGDFETIRAKLTSNVDNKSYMRFEITDEGEMHFYCRKVQNSRLPLMHINGEDRVEVGGRFNIDLYYNEYGLLTYERIYLHAPVDKSKDKTVELDAYYTYR